MGCKWIDVDDSLPEKQDTYLVAFSSEGAGVDVDDFNVKTGQWDFYNKDDMVKVKFWMSIPKPDWRENNEQ